RPSGWSWPPGCSQARRPPAAGSSGPRCRSCGLLGRAALSSDRVQFRQRPLEVELVDGLAEGLETGPADRARERSEEVGKGVGGAAVARLEKHPKTAARRDGHPGAVG